MRWVSIVSAVVVGGVLYASIMERDRLLAIAGVETEGEAAADIDSSDGVIGASTDANAISVVVQRSVAQDVDNTVVLRGRMEAERRVEVMAETMGRIISEPLRRGARVRAGQLLCELDPGTRPAALAEAEARYREAEANAEASERLSERGFTAETTAIANRASLQAAQALIEQAELELGRLKILAPFDGQIESDTAEFGALLQPGSECATVIDLNPMKFVGFVTERMVDFVEPGAPISVRLITGQELEGEVTFVSFSADPDTRTFRVDASIPNPDRTIRDGLTAEGRISAAGTPAHLVPQSALTLDDAGRLGLQLAVDGAAQFASAGVLRDTDEGIWLTDLPDEIDVIVTGQNFVVDGQPLAVTYTGPSE
ncbi:MAG: efflux RND transporter periplasmic adaptor subunit [Pseudomonadota bacterium]